jgi:PTH1 family peptidyl-tRNA hydrolase
MAMKLVVGLGNPGRKYEGTRHNIGFRVLDDLASKLAGQRRQKQSFQADIAECQLGDEKLLLLWPQTFMNLSGGSVQQAKDFYKLTDPELLVICDDFNLPLGKLRFRKAGSSGGQKGMEDILRRLGTDQFARLRIGVGSPPAHFDAADFVLSKFTKEETATMDEAVWRSVDAVQEWVRVGIDNVMNKYNA